MGLISRVSSRTYRFPDETKMVKVIKAQDSVSLEKFGGDVKLIVKGQKVTVIGPRGKLSRDLSHLKVELKKLGAQEVQITKWWATGAGVSALKTVCSHLTNMVVAPDGKSVDIKNFLGEKKLRSVTMMDGVLIKASPKQKDEFWLEGNDVEKVSRTCALISHKAIPRNKDIRKFLDGIYVSQKTEILKDNELLGI